MLTGVYVGDNLSDIDTRLSPGGAMSRVQLALNVNDVDEAVTFYSKLFGTEPAKRRPGYANFAVTEPPLKLVLIENPGHGGSLNHLGVEVEDVDKVDAEQARLAGTGLTSIDKRDTTCCYAKQDKFWVQGAPNGEQWEVYTVLADSPTYGIDDSPTCCTDTANDTANDTETTPTATACC
jgi:catechol 2,3-dioxygenase-like lactoylglutathione lyase family enzyme